MLEHTAQSLATRYLCDWHNIGRRLFVIAFCWLRVISSEQVMVHPLVWPFCMIVLDELADDHVQVLLTKDDEVFESFLL